MITTKKNVLAIFEDPHSSYFRIVNDILALATIVSILAIVLETVPSLYVYEAYFLAIEWATVILFTMEYSIRLWASKVRSKYAFSFFWIN